MATSFHLTLNGLSALRVMRELRRRGYDVARMRRSNLITPHPGARGRWSRGLVHERLKDYPTVASFTSERPLDVAVPKAADRLRFVGATNTVYAAGLSEGAFLEVGEGLYISSPELLFLELASAMDLPRHLLLGMELCGSFARDAANPRGGEVAYQLPAATSVAKIRSFVEGCRGVRGLLAARRTLEYLEDNAWSPMEAVIAAFAVMPAEELGYELWPIDLNARVDAGGGAAKETRVPDIRFRGSDVGLNYDGEGHAPMEDVVDAATKVAANPGSQAAARELAEALERVRKGVVEDKRRDRDLGAAGLTVFAVTKEDLYERGGLDRLMMQVIHRIEREGNRRLGFQRALIANETIGRFRQDLIWSLLPGRQAIEARQRLCASHVSTARAMVHDMTLEDGELVEELVYPL